MVKVYIHGASATGESFNYIREHIGGEDIVINYDSRNGFQKNLEDMLVQLGDQQDMFFICHSLGGIYALHLANAIPDQVLGAVTLSTPYGGAEIADVAKYFLPYSRLLKDIGPHSWAMRQVDAIAVKHPWCNVVTTNGNAPWIHGKNDGVVTVKSQEHHGRDMELIDLDFNHYEVVLSEQVVSIIQERLARIHA
jgi:pimeloyl-ACP methyl ester carboxylesterase